MTLKTFDDVRREGHPTTLARIAELDNILKVTKHTVSRKKLLRERYFWQCESDLVLTEQGFKGKFFERYPDWRGPK